MDQGIDDYVAANRNRYTREAIDKQLLEAGHDHAAIDAAWKRKNAGTTPEPVAREATTATGARIAVSLLVGIGLLVIVANLLGRGGMGAVGWSLAFALIVVSPAAWFGRHRPLGVVALGTFLLLLPTVVLLGLAGISFTSRPGPAIWIALYVIGGGLAVWWAFRRNPPRSVLNWVLSVLGTVVLVLLVAGGTCLVSLPFINA